jgi:prepilin-type processing-associated H-X9-DG protein
MRKLGALVVGLVLTSPVVADEASSAEAHAKAIAPYLDAQTLGLAHIDFTQLNLDALIAQVAEILKLDAGERTAFDQEIRGWVGAFTRAGGKDLYLVFSIADFPNGPYLVVPLEAGADGRALADFLNSDQGARILPAGPRSGGSATVLDQAVFGGSPAALKRIRAGQAQPRPEIARAFAAAGDTTAQFLVLPTADARRAIGEIMPTLPREVGDGPSSLVTRGVLWAAFGVSSPPQLKLRVVIQSENEAAAAALRPLIGRIYAAVGREGGVQQFVPHFAEAARMLMPAVSGDRLTLDLDLNNPQSVGLLQALQQSGFENRHRINCTNNLKQIVLALHNYQNAHGRFPAMANFDKEGKPLLSWRVHILPFLDAGELYKEFHLDESWDSPHNKTLIARMPAVYRCPSMKRILVSKTTYVAPVGEHMMFTGTADGVPIKDVTDGLSNTILVVDANDDRAVIWTKPEDLKIDPNDPLAGLVGHHPGGFNIAFADGSVHFLPQTIDKKNLYALFTRNGAEVVNTP